MIEFTFDFVRVFFIELVYVSPILVFLIFCICFMGYVIGRIEGWSKFDSLYHALINATTVGYGDFRPTKKRSKILAVTIAIVGIVFTGIIVAIGLHASETAFSNMYDKNELNYHIND